ncbi:zinc finger protein 91-like [Pomacea canaliculata]|uniref:zinc finger protein 91-like n=1 Tax=Pomacea canaliculata TaxID=400727 RepID=UPI000D727CAE|nr:zinc finger protein 91-like [Pomacea canaliculata]
MSARNSQVQVPCMISIKSEPTSVADHIKSEFQQSTWKHEPGVKLEFSSQDVTCLIKQDPDKNSVTGAKTEEQLVFKQEDPSHMVKLEHATHIEQSDCKCERTLKLEYHFQCANCSIKPEQDFVHTEKTEEQIVTKEEQEGSQKEKIKTDRPAIWQNDSNEKCEEMSVHRCNAYEVMDNEESQQNKTHSDVQLHPHQCSLCKAAFKISSRLKRHMLVHSDERSFQCSLCKAAFKLSSHLKRHMQVHSDKKYYQCSLCKATFKRSSHLKRHMHVHSNLKPIQCTLCKFTFKNSKYLKQHMIVHSDVKPIQCSSCKATFKCLSYLKKHMATHSDVKSYQCSLCPATFKWSSNLKRHMLVHSSE